MRKFVTWLLDGTKNYESKTNILAAFVIAGVFSAQYGHVALGLTIAGIGTAYGVYLYFNRHWSTNDQENN